MTVKVSEANLANENGEAKDTTTQTEKGFILKILKLCRTSAKAGNLLGGARKLVASSSEGEWGGSLRLFSILMNLGSFYYLLSVVRLFIFNSSNTSLAIGVPFITFFLW